LLSVLFINCSYSIVGLFVVHIHKQRCQVYARFGCLDISLLYFLFFLFLTWTTWISWFYFIVEMLWLWNFRIWILLYFFYLIIILFLNILWSYNTIIIVAFTITLVIVIFFIILRFFFLKFPFLFFIIWSTFFLKMWLIILLWGSFSERLSLKVVIFFILFEYSLCPTFKCVSKTFSSMKWVFFLSQRLNNLYCITILLSNLFTNKVIKNYFKRTNQYFQQNQSTFIEILSETI
jgi:hypothetical protein